MGTIIVEKDQLDHFTHEHMLSLVHLQQPKRKNESDDDEDEDEEKDDFVEEEHHGGQCNMCNEQILSFHLCYYYCDSCDYSLHKFCAELPQRYKNHPLHPQHDLRIYKDKIKCFVCKLDFKHMGIYEYYCSVCRIDMDITCATGFEQKINHPSHPHQLERMFGPKVSNCIACGNKHEGVFFQCTACPMFLINLDCVLLPDKLLIQKHTNGTFTHSHPLTLAYSFPYSEQEARFAPRCRVCGGDFYPHLWIYKCDKCRYYVHVDCATSKREPFMSILQSTNLGKTSKNFKEDEHPNLLHCPLEDEGDNLLKRHMIMSNYQKEKEQHAAETLIHYSHQHPLILFDEQTSVTVSLHDPMKRSQLLCDGCVKPIMTVPFYMCGDEQCCFVLHEWCANLPSEVQNYTGHHEHPLSLLAKIPNKLFGVFDCAMCRLQSNGFAYGCTICEYYVDINCAFIPKEITHDSHPNHLLSILNFDGDKRCKACRYLIQTLGFHCPSCDFYLHVECALLLPKVIKHKCDKHPLSLRYDPAENHIGQYFCEICETEFNPWEWFYHCATCAQSMHAACGPLILECEQDTYASDLKCVYKFLNVKFGGMFEMKGHPHRLAFVQGLERDGECSRCGEELQYKMIFKCLECEFALDYRCASKCA